MKNLVADLSKINNDNIHSLMNELNITYRIEKSNKDENKWYFIDCENVPNELPEFLNVFIDLSIILDYEEIKFLKSISSTPFTEFDSIGLKSFKLNKPNAVKDIKTFTFIDNINDGDIIDLHFRYYKNYSKLNITPIDSKLNGFSIGQYDINSNEYIEPNQDAIDVFRINIEKDFSKLTFLINGYYDYPIILEELKTP